MRILSTTLAALAFSAATAYAEPVENEIPLALQQAKQEEEPKPIIPGYAWRENTSDQSCLMRNNALPGAIDLYDTISRPTEMPDVNGAWKWVVFCEEKFKTEKEYRRSLEKPADLVSSVGQQLQRWISVHLSRSV